ncbi:hypothetical protein B0H66DRAFT_559989 [Apodospora peruviana]|uniref:Cerato-platanin n=1 Tax=Apodospora peruviana TaxID=516989 RepID=A0AAE0I0B0_9PEZI|nr:hypothetical protein B0H66DRAFT_559989 [Apodospora peruviana]
MIFSAPIKAVLALAASASLTSAISVSVTPHEQYSSSVGVLGCKINTNRVAYWPMAVDCNNICVKVSYSGRSVYLLRIDQSGGAYDISYDAWNYLKTGQSATANPTAGGGIQMDYQNVAAENCASLIHSSSGGLPLSASNSMNYVASCISQSNSWVGKHHELINILNPTCTWGYDEVCSLNLAVSNQPTCPHQLGVPAVLKDRPVINIQYPTGKQVVAP